MTRNPKLDDYMAIKSERLSAYPGCQDGDNTSIANRAASLLAAAIWQEAKYFLPDNQQILNNATSDNNNLAIIPVVEMVEVISENGDVIEIDTILGGGTKLKDDSLLSQLPEKEPRASQPAIQWSSANRTGYQHKFRSASPHVLNNYCLFRPVTPSWAEICEQAFKRAHLKEPNIQACRNVQFDQSNSIDRIAKVISDHEGVFDSINWNDKGAGISAGIFQANQKCGELPKLLVNMQAADRSLFTSIFGSAFASIVKNNPNDIRHMTFTNDSKTGPNEWGKRLKEALRQAVFKNVQIDMLHQKIVHASHIAAQYGITSERGVALVADMVNQLGEGGKSCGARHYLQFALTEERQIDKINAIVAHNSRCEGRAQRDRDILSRSNLEDS